MSESKRLPKSWTLTSITNLAKIEMGQSPESAYYNDEGKGLPFFQGKAEFGAVYPVVKKWCSRPKKVAEAGDILLSIRAPVGPTNIAKSRSAIGRGLAAICAQAPISQKYIFYFLRKIEPWLSSQGTGSTFAAISGDFLRTIQVPVAPAVEQTRIVEKLEELLSDLDAGVAELKAAQKKLAQYRQSLLKAAVEGALTAEWRSSQAVASVESGAELLARILRERRARWEARQLAKFKEQGKAPPKDWQAKYPEPVAPDTTGLPALPYGWVWASIDQLSPDDLANGRSVPTATNGAKVLRLTAVKNGQIDLRECKTGDWSVDEAKPFAVAKGDLLIVRGNGSLTLVGRAGMVPAVLEQVAYPDTMIRLRVVESVVRPAWVGLLWDASITRDHLEGRARTSAGIYKISQPDIASVVIPVPPLNEQDLVLSMFEQTGEEMRVVQDMVERGLKQSAAQRKNILQAAFSGRLVPQDPTDEPASVLLERIRTERAAQTSPITPRRRATKIK